MIVLNPANTAHNLKVIPRFYPSGEVSISLFNEGTKETATFTDTAYNLDGYMYVSINAELADKSNYQIKIMQEEEIVYRGKIFVTTQYNDTQNYKITKDIFTYGS